MDTSTTPPASEGVSISHDSNCIKYAANGGQMAPYALLSVAVASANVAPHDWSVLSRGRFGS